MNSAISIVERTLAGELARPEVHTFFDRDTFTATHVVRDPRSDACAVIDSVLDFDYASGRTEEKSAEKLARHIETAALRTEWILETHAHADHLSAAPWLQARLGGKLAIGQHITAVQAVFGKIFNAGTAFARDGSQFDHLFDDGECFQIGSLEGIALHVPGHTPACMAYVIGDTVFTGDTLFMPDYGTARCDFPGGDAATLYRSIKRLLALPEQTRVFVCHDYTAPPRDVYAWETTIGQQRASNIHVHDGIDEPTFVAMREKRDATLSMPKLMLPSVQVNMQAGHLPEPEDNGVRYLKVPLNTL
ncbi:MULTISPECIES: MBL fold metallo-hydrolase [unclassified Bordetella]|uniref:MBL fold metallo-hydrolase n=1 Tax=unclassified Bordetella TaxID=2630031 RepID=UPI001EF055BE|nr:MULTISPECIES: MBL fold metallo-hydrolase [unclassified Bordetella]